MMYINRGIEEVQGLNRDALVVYQIMCAAKDKSIILMTTYKHALGNI